MDAALIAACTCCSAMSRLSARSNCKVTTDEPAEDTVAALLHVLPKVRGAFSLVILDQHRVIGVRDPHGFRPLVLGRLPAAERPPGGPDDGLWAADAETGADRGETGRETGADAVAGVLRDQLRDPCILEQSEHWVPRDVWKSGKGGSS